MAKSIFGKSEILSYKGTSKQDLQSDYSLLYLATLLALEMMFYQIVSMWLSPMTKCYCKNMANSTIDIKP